MKKLIILILSVITIACAAFAFSACDLGFLYPEYEDKPTYSTVTEDSSVAQKETSSKWTGGLVDGGTFSAH